jgi:hypothetical protein
MDLTNVVSWVNLQQTMQQREGHYRYNITLEQAELADLRNIKGDLRSGRKTRKPKLLIAASDVQLQLDRRLDEGTFANVYSGNWDGSEVAVKQFKLEGIRQEQADEVRVSKSHTVHGLCRRALILICYKNCEWLSDFTMNG